jgi:D-sedoheptulose 7-phosphate isomerase
MTATLSLTTPRPGAAPPDDLCQIIRDRSRALSAALDLIAHNGADVASAAAIITQALRGGGVALVCGNGGSAADAQHFVGELVGRFRRERAPFPALSLTADSAVLTAIANDYGFDTVFARQVAAFGRPGDVFVGFSTSGESHNVVNAARAARERGMTVVAFTGPAPTSLGEASDVQIAVPSADTALIQEAHGVVMHIISEVIEATLAGELGAEERV